MTPGDEADGELSALYKRKPITVWVEDELTRVWLRGVWADGDIDVWVAGGGAAVRAVVTDARRRGHPMVFGVVDRDFGRTNEERWPNKDLDVFVPARHEVENYLLDFDGLAAMGSELNPHARDARDLRNCAHDAAEQRLWWLASKAVMAEVKSALPHGFPKDPSLGETQTRDDALHMLLRKLPIPPWQEQVQTTMLAMAPTELATRLDFHASVLRTKLENDAWVVEWPGKELVEAVVRRLLADPHQPLQKTLIYDVARALAAWQRSEEQRRDPTSMKLLSELRARL